MEEADGDAVGGWRRQNKGGSGVGSPVDPDSGKQWVETRLGRDLGNGADADTEKKQTSSSQCQYELCQRQRQVGIKAQCVCCMWVFAKMHRGWV